MHKNDTEPNDTESSILPLTPPPSAPARARPKDRMRMDEMERYRERIRENIDFDALLDEHPYRLELPGHIISDPTFITLCNSFHINAWECDKVAHTNLNFDCPSRERDYLLLPVFFLVSETLPENGDSVFPASPNTNRAALGCDDLLKSNHRLRRIELPDHGQPIPKFGPAVMD